jgi:hypothetical protein
LLLLLLLLEFIGFCLENIDLLFELLLVLVLVLMFGDIVLDTLFCGDGLVLLFEEDGLLLLELLLLLLLALLLVFFFLLLSFILLLLVFLLFFTCSMNLVEF